MIVAHPDDIEYGAAGAIARWTGQGKTIAYIMVTSGEAGIDGLHPDECRALREAEEINSARIVGVELGRVPRLPRRHSDLRPRAARGRREGRAPAPARDRDHRQLPRPVRTGGAQPGRPHRHRAGSARRRPRRRQPLDLPRAARPTGSSRGAAYGRCGLPGRPRRRHGVDVTDTFDVGVASLEAHDAYIKGLGWEGWSAREFLEGILRHGGARMGTTYAAAFEVYSLVWGGHRRGLTPWFRGSLRSHLNQRSAASSRPRRRDRPRRRRRRSGRHGSASGCTPRRPVARPRRSRPRRPRGSPRGPRPTPAVPNTIRTLRGSGHRRFSVPVMVAGHQRRAGFDGEPGGAALRRTEALVADPGALGEQRQRVAAGEDRAGGVERVGVGLAAPDRESTEPQEDPAPSAPRSARPCP